MYIKQTIKVAEFSPTEHQKSWFHYLEGYSESCREVLKIQPTSNSIYSYNIDFSFSLSRLGSPILWSVAPGGPAAPNWWLLFPKVAARVFLGKGSFTSLIPSNAAVAPMDLLSSVVGAELRRPMTDLPASIEASIWQQRLPHSLPLNRPNPPFPLPLPPPWSDSPMVSAAGEPAGRSACAEGLRWLVGPSTRTPTSPGAKNILYGMFMAPRDSTGLLPMAEPTTSSSSKSHWGTHHINATMLAIMNLIVSNNGTAVSPNLNSCQCIPCWKR